jgi:hypothetical protein
MMKNKPVRIKVKDLERPDLKNLNQNKHAKYRPKMVVFL